LELTANKAMGYALGMETVVKNHQQMGMKNPLGRD
jgi:hypothetical protein